MKIVIVYIYPCNLNGSSDDYVCRFLGNYVAHPTNIDHESIVVLNGGKQDNYLTCLFSPLRNLRFFEHDGSGWDIGAFQKVAESVPADMMVFFGTSAWIKKNSWLEIMAGSFLRHGYHLFGSMGNQGGGIVHPHIRTTGFWMNPGLLNEYPHKVTTPPQRYPFEHGPQCLTNYVWSRGLKAFVVTASGEYEYPNWDSIPNGYHQGDQSALLVGDRVSDPPYHPVP